MHGRGVGDEASKMDRVLEGKFCLHGERCLIRSRMTEARKKRLLQQVLQMIKLLFPPA